MTKEEMQAIVDMLDSRLDEKFSENLKPIQERLDKIDSRFEKIDSRFEKIDSRFDGIDYRLGELGEGQQRLEARQSKLEENQSKLELKIENEVDRSIKVLSDGILTIERKLDENAKLENRVDTLEHKVSAIEYIAREKLI